MQRPAPGALLKKIRELEESRQQYMLLAENISDVIWMPDPDLTIQYISPSIRAMGGFDPKALEGTPFIDLLASSHADAFSRLIRNEVLQQGATLEIQVEHRPDGETSWIEIKASLVTDRRTHRKNILGISRDITARRSLQAQKMESVGALAGGIAHDFNNLLTVINGYADMGLKKIDEDHDLFKSLSVIRQAGQRATHLTRQLLAFSRKQVYTPHPLDINQAIAGMDKILRRLIGEDIAVDTLLAKDLPKILADQAQIEQVFTNLVVNAQDSLNETEPGSRPKRITIETGRAVFPEESRHCRRHDGNPFPDPGHQGTGLGLATAYGIVHQNRGSIQVYSEPGQGYRVDWIKGELATGKPGPDLVVTDLVMPELNGREFIRVASKILPDLKVIYVSGYTDTHGILESGVNYLQKPYSRNDLGNIVRRVLDEIKNSLPFTHPRGNSHKP